MVAKRAQNVVPNNVAIYCAKLHVAIVWPGLYFYVDETQLNTIVIK